MTEFRKVHKFKKTAEGHLYKLKKLGDNGRIVIENTDGKTVYVVVYTLEEKKDEKEKL